MNCPHHDRPKRLHIPIAAKRIAALRQGGVCPCGCGTPCWADAGRPYPRKALVEWDHDPALRRRDINEAGDDYIPPQLDPAYIVGRCEVSHLAKTSGTGATTAGSDIGAIKKERKRNKALAGLKKPKQKWGSGTLCSRNQFQQSKGKSQWPKAGSRKINSRASLTGSSGFLKKGKP